MYLRYIVLLPVEKRDFQTGSELFRHDVALVFFSKSSELKSDISFGLTCVIGARRRQHLKYPMKGFRFQAGTAVTHG